MKPVLRAIVAALAVGTSAHHVPELSAGPPDGGEHPVPARLADTGLHAPGDPGRIDASSRPFSPQYPLWSDGATKKRWIRLPPGTTIDATDPHRWQFPVGTRLWKEFAFGGRRVETRMLWRASAGQWVAASYAWNEDGTEAVLVPESGVPGVVELAPGRRHSIPSRQDCTACHGARAEPLGFNALQLSTDRDPHAIHGEPLEPGMITLGTLAEERLLSPAGDSLVANPPRIAAANPQTRAVLGYLFANCGGCHDDSGEISVTSLALPYAALLRDAGSVVRRLAGHPTNWQVPGRPDGASLLLDVRAPEHSALLVRMRSRRPSSQMPPLGTVVPDQDAIDRIARWLAQDLATRAD